MKAILQIFLFIVLLFASTDSFAARGRIKAKLDVSPVTCESPCEVRLSAKRSRPSRGATITNYVFNLGNGETIESSSPVVSYTYKVLKSDLEDSKFKGRGFFNYLKWMIERIRNRHSVKVFNPTVLVSDSKNKSARSNRKFVRVSAEEGDGTNRPPVASFTFSSEDTVAPATIQFDASASSDPDGTIATYLIDFGDGVTSSESTSSHIYQTPGSYTVSLTVTDDLGLTHNTTKTLTITANTLPIPRFILSPETGRVPQLVTFDATSSSDADGSIVKYDWSIGDSNSATGKTTSYNFTEVGTFTVSLTVTDNKGATQTKNSSISILPANKSPSANFTLSEGPYIAPHAITFNGEASSDSDGTITSYLYDFGDGQTSDKVTLVHTYQTAGTFNAKLTVTDNEGATNVFAIVIVVKANIAPVSSFTFTTTDNTAPATFSFNGAASTDADGTIIGHLYDFGDGVTSINSVTNHIYQNAGTYTVSLVVTDNLGATHKTEKSVEVIGNALPVANFTFSPATGKAPQNIVFDASTSSDTDGSISEYRWTFAPNSTATGKTASFNYTDAGTYDISLTVLDNRGGSSTKISSITILPTNVIPVATFTLSAGEYIAPHTVSFNGEGSNDSDGTITTYKYDFGDGSTSDQMVVDHKYELPGTYVAKLTVTDNDGVTHTASKEIVVKANISPVSSFTAASVDNTAPATFSFDGSTSSDADGTVSSYLYDFGDGVTSNQSIATHVYQNAGLYTASLTVIDNMGATHTSEKEIEVIGNSLPVASFTFTPISGKAPQNIIFDASASSDTDGSISVYRWNFGPDKNSEGITASFTYTEAGTYDVTLTVVDNRGASTSKTSSITILPPNNPPAAIFTLSDGEYVAPQIINFNGERSTDSDGSVVSFHYDFGDGTTLDQAVVEHTYELPGSFSIVLTVTDNEGLSSQYSQDIVVKENAAPVAEFSITGDGAIAPAEMQFNASESSDSDGSIVSWSWDIANGVKYTGESITHTFQNEGTFPVILTVTDNKGVASELTKNVTVSTNSGNKPPVIVEIFHGRLQAGPPVKMFFGIDEASDEDGEIVSYIWNFGDGQEIEVPTSRDDEGYVTHEYVREGTYQVKVTAVDDNGGETEKIETVVVNNSKMPVARFSPSAISGNAPLTVEFDATASHDPDGTITEYEWKFYEGDNRTYGENANIASYTFTEPGIHEVKLEVYDNTGGSDITRINIYVGTPAPENGLAPRAMFSTTSRRVLTNTVIEADASLSFDVDGSIVSYKWNFGDYYKAGNLVEGISASHSYANPGTYRIELIITDNLENESSTFSTIYIQNETGTQPNPDLFAFHEGNKEFTFRADPNFLTHSYNQDILYWKMGDGTSKEGDEVWHEYGADGQYTVSLQLNEIDEGVFNVTKDIQISQSIVSPQININDEMQVAKDQEVEFDASGTIAGDQSELSYRWSFGDGNLIVGTGATFAKVKHTYSSNGFHDALLIVTNSQGISDKTWIAVNVTGGAIPVANFTASTLQGMAPLTVTFDASSSVDSDGEIVSYQWEFDETEGYSHPYGVGQTLVHTFETPGRYEVALTVIDNEGNISSHDVEIEVTSPQSVPISEFNCNTDMSGTLECHSTSYDSDGFVTSEMWFVNGEEVGSGIDLWYPLMGSGIYNVVLEIMDNEGNVASSTQDITANDGYSEIIASINYHLVSGKTFELFADVFSSNGTPITEYIWTIDGGIQLNGQIVTHTFESAGAHYVELTVRDQNGTEVTVSEQIHVASPPVASLSCSTEGKVLSCDAGDSYDPDGMIESYNYNLGDGTFLDGSSTVGHTYQSSGTYNIELTVFDNDGNSDTTTQTIEATNGIPTAVINCDIYEKQVNCDSNGSSDDGYITNYSFDFGDGNTVEGQSSASNTYSQPGNYSIKLTVTDDEGAVASATHSVTIDNMSPSASFFINYSDNIAPAIVTFDSSGSYDQDGTIDHYLFDFGDGTTSTDSSPSHVYQGAGEYTVTLTVTDNFGKTSMSQNIIGIVGNELPVSSFTFSPNSGKAPLTVNFDSSNSYDSDGSIATYSWSINGTTVSAEQSPQHVFTEAGTYPLSLTVTDNKGGKSTMTSSITVLPSNVRPVASFTLSDGPYRATFPVSFDGTGSLDSDGSITSYHYDFGDNTTSTSASPVHTYQVPGTYEVVLTVTDDEGLQGTQASIVTVLSSNIDPVASFTISDGPFIAPQAVQFNGQGSYDSDGTIASYLYDFDDSTTSDLQSPEHIYEAAGTYNVILTVTDDKGATASHVIPLVIKENIIPVPQILITGDNSKAPAEIQFSAEGSSDSDGQIVSWKWELDDGTILFGEKVTHIFVLEGTYSVLMSITDDKGAVSTKTISINVAPTNMPPIPSLSSDIFTGEFPLPVTFDASLSEDIDGEIIGYEWDFGDDHTDFTTVPVATYEYLFAGTYEATVIVIDNDGARSSASISIHVDEGVIIPPDPKEVATELPEKESITLVEATSFLYDAPNAIQKGVEPGTIVEDKVTIIRGLILDKNNDPLPGVKVFFKDNRDYGYTFSRADGEFDMAINGGGSSVISFAKSGYLSVQRTISGKWQDYNVLDDIVMSALDLKVTEVQLSEITEMISVEGSTSIDDRGERTASLAIAPGTTAEMVLPDGTRTSLEKIDIRITEFTVGENGPESMPGALPPSSAYTYAVEFSVDQAIAAGATTVEFSKPIYNYVDNFVDAPVGLVVPSGYYDREVGKWIPSENGAVMQLLSITDGIANVDVFGTGVPATEAELAIVKMTVEERKVIASRFQANDTFWRVPIRHFTPYDLNFMVWIEEFVDKSIVASKDQVFQESQNPSTVCGSIIDVNNRCLGEHVAIPGSPHSLTYSTKYSRDNAGPRTLHIPVIGNFVNPRSLGFELSISVAGQRHEVEFDEAPGQIYDFIWDGLDAYGRKVYGPQNVSVVIREKQPQTFCAPSSRQSYSSNQDQSGGETFGRWVPASSVRVLVGAAIFDDFFKTGCFSSSIPMATQVASFDLIIGSIDIASQKMGGWSLDHFHSYDTAGGRLFRGDGTVKEITGVGGGVLKKAYGLNGETSRDSIELPDGSPIGDLKFGANGDVYFHESCGISKLSSDNTYTRIIRDSHCPTSWIDNTEVTESISSISDFDLDSDGNLYFINGPAGKVYKIDSSYNLELLGGRGGSPRQDFTATGHIKDATFYRLSSIVAAKDGSLYLGAWDTIMHVLPSGATNILAGGGHSHPMKDESILPSEISISYLTDLTVTDEGEVYFVNGGTYVVKLTKEKEIELVAGNPNYEIPRYTGGVVSPADVTLVDVQRLASDDKGLYILDRSLAKVLYLDFATETLGTIFGNGVHDDTPVYDYDSSMEASLQPSLAFAIGPDGNIYLGPDGASIHRIQFSERISNDGTILIPQDNEVYEFNKTGVHLRTIDLMTGIDKYRFEYESGHLTKIIDRFGQELILNRDNDHIVRSVTSENGLVTLLDINSEGQLSAISYPDGASYSMSYKEGTTLLESFTKPMGDTSYLEYDSNGKISKDIDAAGGFKEIIELPTNDRGIKNIEVTTAEGRSTLYTARQNSYGTSNRTTSPSGSIQHRGYDIENRKWYTSSSSGQRSDEFIWPGLFSELSPDIYKKMITLGDGLTKEILYTRDYQLADRLDPMSLTGLTTNIEVNGKLFTTVYDKASLTTVSTSPEGVVSTIQLTDKGQVETQEVSGLFATSYDYRTDGKVNTITTGSRVTQFVYDDKGTLKSIVDPEEHETLYEHDTIGRVTATQSPDGSISSFRYDLNGNLVGVTPSERPEHVFAINNINMVENYDAPLIEVDPTTTSYDYNLDRDLLSITRPDGKAIFVSYKTMPDGAPTNLLESISTDDGIITVAYNEGDQVTAVEGPVGSTLSYEYDRALVSKMSLAGVVSGDVEFSYNNDFVPNLIKVNGLAIIYNYNDDGKISSAGNMVLDYDVDKGGLISGTSIQSVTDSYNFSGYGELSTYTAQVSGSDLVSYDYTRDKLGRITKVTEVSGGQTVGTEYSYDLAGRLSTVKVNDIVAESYQYGANGSRVDGTYDDQDRLLEDFEHKYTYTKAGELLTKTRKSDSKVETYNYDVYGNLRDVQTFDGRSIVYLVDGQSRRIGKRIDGALVQGLIYKDQLNPIAELDSNGVIKSTFVYATKPHVPDYIVQGADMYRIVTDHLGSVRYVVKVDDGTIVQEMTYSTFGKVLSDSNPGFQPFGFAGGIYDRDTGLTRFGARDYEPALGRWTSKDPIEFEGDDTNLYRYASGDPVNLIDPSGLLSFWENLQRRKRVNKDFVKFIGEKGASLVLGAAVLRAGGAVSLGQAFRSRLNFSNLGRAGTIGSLALGFALKAGAVAVSFGSGFYSGDYLGAYLDTVVDNGGFGSSVLESLYFGSGQPNRSTSCQKK